MSRVEFTSNMGKIRGVLRRGYRRNITEAVLIWERGIKRIMTGARSGREYPVPNTRQTYTASAPGEAPAVRTGDLRGSYYHAVPSDTEGLLGSELQHALFLERGTSRMEPRPALLPSLRNNERAIQMAMAREIRE